VLSCKPFKNPEIPILENYTSSGNKEFWDSFPVNLNICDIESRINVKNLEAWINRLEQKLTASQKARAQKTVNFLKKGAPAYQKSNLPSCFEKNGSSALKHGAYVTDNIASWVKKGYACGPFDTPPFKKFRVNPIIAIPQDGKVRVVLNVSKPDGKSFNDNIADNRLEKVHMSSARQFGYILKSCGKNAKFSKSDLNDAYKLIPALIEELWLQGFYWNTKFFCEKSQIFGARSAVCNFDVAGNTFNTLCIVYSETNPDLVCRHLDDNTNAGSADSKNCEKFTACYKEICADLNIPLAADCPKFEKAFSNSTKGKVLGIEFDSSDLSWSLPQDKTTKTLRLAYQALNGVLISTLDMQKLLGCLNYVSLMAPFLNGFRRNLFNDLAYSVAKDLPNVRLSDPAKNDLKIWVGFILDSSAGHPIPSRPCSPPVFCKTFYSDAAGRADGSFAKDKVGVASVGFSEDGVINHAKRIWWNEEMLRSLDEDGKKFGNKTMMLETIGLLLPFLFVPQLLKNQHIVLYVDNIGCCDSWDSRYSKEDQYTSILLRCLHLISCYLSSIVHVLHCPRRSNWASSKVDDMSRSSTSSTADDRLIKSFGYSKMPTCMKQWLSNPVTDWSLPVKLLREVREINNI